MRRAYVSLGYPHEPLFVSTIGVGLRTIGAIAPNLSLFFMDISEQTALKTGIFSNL